jgi:hypothetical protein
VIAFSVLVLITVWLVFDYAYVEPFSVFRARDAYLYLVLGTANLVGWCAIVLSLLVRSIRKQVSAWGLALLCASMFGGWYAAWLPCLYIQDLTQLEAMRSGRQHQKP